jgi:H+/Cl- antiporter ClcA
MITVLACFHRLHAKSKMASETTSLLPKTTEDEHRQHGEIRHDDPRSFDGESIEVAEMKKVTHNYPTLAEEEDLKKLRGSTLMLYNNVVADEMSQSTRRKPLNDFQGIGRSKKALHSGSSRLSLIYNRQKDHAMLYLEKVKTNFFQDAKSLAEGTIPQSIVLALAIGVVCGIACWLYYSVLFFFLEFLWTTLPEKVVIDKWDEEIHWLWIPLVSFVMITFVGLTVVYMGEPGDLPYTIGRVHAQAYIPMNHVSPMVFASLFSILGKFEWKESHGVLLIGHSPILSCTQQLAGGSLGPEAPLVAICGALGGFISRRIFLQKHINVVRKHTLMGMGGALAAFFGVPLGGSLFALEVCSRFGVEYFEHLIEAIFCGEICLVVFRSLSGLPIAPIWNLTAVSGRMVETTPMQVLLGAMIGLYGAFWATCFARFHWWVMEIFGKLNLLDNKRAVLRGWLGGFFVVLMAVLVPHTGKKSAELMLSCVSSKIEALMVKINCCSLLG